MNLIPLKDWLYLGAIVALLTGFGLFVHHERQIGAQKVEAAVHAAAAEATASAATETTRRIVAIQDVIHETTTQAARVATDAASASAARDALRVQLDAYVRRSRVPGRPASAASGTATPDPDVLLAGLLNAAWNRSVDLAAEADRRGVAGDACVRAYDSLTLTH